MTRQILFKETKLGTFWSIFVDDKLIEDIAMAYPNCEFWVDAGLEFIKKTPACSNIKTVLGSENTFTEEQLANFILNNPDIILSLDFNETGLIENTYLLQRPELWPQRLIVMMLHRVGSNKGIDTEQLNAVQSMGIDKEIYSAGGVRNIKDLLKLKQNRIKGVLLASALHNGSIAKEELIQISNNEFV